MALYVGKRNLTVITNCILDYFSVSGWASKLPKCGKNVLKAYHTYVLYIKYLGRF